MELITHEASAETVRRCAGNKAAGLHTLTNRGVAVPAWAVISTDAFTKFCERDGIARDLGVLTDGLTPERAATVAEAARRRIVDAPLDDELLALVAEALEFVGDGPVAVRSSGVEEDGSEYSFAGQFETHLHVEGRDCVAARVKQCWASAYSERALVYRHQRGLAPSVAMAVIVQRMVPAEKAGVLFTANPANGRRDQLVVSSVWGLGDALVSGAVDADTIVLDRASGARADTTIGEKNVRYEAASAGEGTVAVAVPEEQQAALSLRDDELEQLRGLADRVEAIFGAPQDVEWAYSNGALWILQSRPITGLPAAAATGERRGQLLIWDNSNIIENFPGVTAPLTFTFGQHVYHRVAEEYCHLLLPRRYVQQMDETLSNLLGYFHGRVYYNLINWYKVTGLTAPATLNRRMMEVGMGVAETLDLDEFAERIRPFEPRSRWEGRAIRVYSIAKWLWYFFGIQRYVRRFRREFYEVFDEFDPLDYDAMPADRIFALYRDFEGKLLPSWGHVLHIESNIGIPYGVLRKLTERWLPTAPEWFYTQVLGGLNIESLEPARRLQELARTAFANPELEKLLRETPASSTMQALSEAGCGEFLEQVERYIRDFGYRCINELKLEEPDLQQDPAVFFDMLKTSLAVAGHELASKSHDAAGSADEILKPLRGWRRLVFERVRRRVRMALEARESVRFCRSRAFGIIRRMFRALGNDLERAGVLKSASDVFQLRLDELAGCFNGTLSHLELPALVEQRKRDAEIYRALAHAPARFATRGPVYWMGNLESSAWCDEATTGAEGDELRGTPCAPGRVEGSASVVSSPAEFTGGILVTYRTDPGWVPAFGSASALLIERGSPLTHAAIVARELGVPTIVQIRGLTRRVRTGMRLRVDGNEGRIEILRDAQEEGPTEGEASG